MNHATIRDATAHAFHDATIRELRRRIADWLAAHNFARQQKPELFQATDHYAPGPNIKGAAWTQAPAVTAGRWMAAGVTCPVPGLLRPANGTSNIACQALPRAYASH